MPRAAAIATLQPSASAERMRRYRARMAAGEMVLRVAVDDVAFPAWAISHGLLAPSSIDDREAIERAASAALRSLYDAA